MHDAHRRGELATGLAAAFLSGPWDRAGLRQSGETALSQWPRWLAPLVGEVLTAYPRRPGDRPRELARHIGSVLRRRTYEIAVPSSPGGPPRIRTWLSFESSMGRCRWPVPPITTQGELAERLELDPSQLAWLADARGLERDTPASRLRNYSYHWIARRHGRDRLIERPKPRLKDIQRWILHEILDAIPAHDAAHGFVAGRSARTHAALHTGQPAVVGMDLEDFFAAVSVTRVYGVFRVAGYPEGVAHALAALTTNVVPSEVWEAAPLPDPPGGPSPRSEPGATSSAAANDTATSSADTATSSADTATSSVDTATSSVDTATSSADAAAAMALTRHYRLGRRLATPHLPQGAPTSPALASLAAYSLDVRLAGLARSRDLTYSRYADDLTFSGRHAAAAGLRRVVPAIVADEGFSLNPVKTRRRTASQRQVVTGVVVNQRLNVARREYDQLKAILHDVERHGAAVANRAGHPELRAHLLGRIAWVQSLNPARGNRLRRRFDSVAW